MIASIRTRFEWKIQWLHGDIEAIVEFSKTPEKPNGLCRKTIWRALKTGRMHDETFDAINRFYNKRREERKSEKLKITIEEE